MKMKRRVEKSKASRAPENESRNDGGRYPYAIGGKMDHQQETFACPFYRRYPLRFPNCINVRLATISVVKQHLKRRHVSSSSYPVCGNGSACSKDPDVHRWERRCSECERDDFYSIPPCKLAALERRCKRGLSPEGQWQGIWEILFGTLDASPDPFSHGTFKEITAIIRDIWSRDGKEIISSCLQAQGMPIGSGQLLSLLPELLDRIDERFERKLPESNKNEQTPNAGKAGMKATLGGTTYFDLSSTNFEPPSDQGFQTPGRDALVNPTLLARESSMPESSIGWFDDLQISGVVPESQSHHWECNLNNLAMPSELFGTTNFLDVPEYPYDLF